MQNPYTEQLEEAKATVDNLAKKISECVLVKGKNKALQTMESILKTAIPKIVH